MDLETVASSVVETVRTLEISVVVVILGDPRASEDSDDEL